MESLTELANNLDEERKERLRLRKGLCPHYDTCISRTESYYCRNDRNGLIILGKIICYSPVKEDQIIGRI